MCEGWKWAHRNSHGKQCMLTKNNHGFMVNNNNHGEGVCVRECTSCSCKTFPACAMSTFCPVVHLRLCESVCQRASAENVLVNLRRLWPISLRCSPSLWHVCAPAQREDQRAERDCEIEIERRAGEMKERMETGNGGKSRFLEWIGIQREEDRVVKEQETLILDFLFPDSNETEMSQCWQQTV